MLQALHIYIKICRYTKETTFSPSFGELIVHTDLVWDLLIINLKVFQSFFDTDTIPSVSCIFFLFFFFSHWHPVPYSIIPGTRWGFVLVFKTEQLRC